MKRWIQRGIIGACAVLFGIYGLIYLQNGRMMEVYNSFSMTSGSYMEERLSVVANRLYIKDKMACAEEIVKRCRENGFHNILFSYDYAIPNELQVTVYLSEEDVKEGKEIFSFTYTSRENSEEYNIVEHPEKFEIQIETES